jgi:hypothetical protein
MIGAVGRLVERARGPARAYLVIQKLLAADRPRRVCVGVLAPRAGERILDIGCGVGHVLDYLPAVGRVPGSRARPQNAA